MGLMVIYEIFGKLYFSANCQKTHFFVWECHLPYVLFID